MVKVHEIYWDWLDVVLNVLKLEDRMDYEQSEREEVFDGNDDSRARREVSFEVFDDHPRVDVENCLSKENNLYLHRDPSHELDWTSCRIR